MLHSKCKFGREGRCPIALILLVSIEAVDVLCVKATVVVFVIDVDDIMEEGLEPFLTAKNKTELHSTTILNIEIPTCPV